MTAHPQHTDQPITGDDNAPDLLGRDPFAAQVARVLLRTPREPGIVLSLEGAWGFGKTSLGNLIQRHLERAEKPPIVLNFNPWMIGNAETLIQAFLVQLAAAINLKDRSKEGQRAARELLSYTSIFDALKFIPGAEPWASIVQGVFKAVGKASGDMAGLKKLDLDGHRRAAVQALSELHKNVVVFIDDVDRLPPAEVFVMIRLVKAVADFPAMSYVLCYDPTYIRHALVAHDVGEPSEYLDKIVQTRLSVPAISPTDLMDMLNAELAALPAEAVERHFNSVEERHSVLYFGGMARLMETPRDVKRLFNRLRFSEAGCRGEVNLADLVSLEAIALKAPTVHEHIRTNPSAYVGEQPGVTNFDGAKKIVEAGAAGRTAALDAAPPRLRAAVASLLGHLFPRISSEHYSHERARRDGLISAPDRLMIALSAGLPRGEVAYSGAREFLRHPAARLSLLDQAIATRSLKRFLEHIVLVLDDQQAVQPRDAAIAIASAIDTAAVARLENDSRGVSFFEQSPSRLARWAVENLIRSASGPERQEILKAVVLNRKGLSVAAAVLTILHAQHGASGTEGSLPEGHRWVSEETLRKLTRAWVKIVREGLERGDLLEATRADIVLYRARLFDAARLKRDLRRLIAEDANFERLALALGHRGTDSLGGRFAHFPEEELDAFGGAKALRTKARQRLADPTVQGELRHVLMAITSGKKTYVSDGTSAEDSDA